MSDPTELDLVRAELAALRAELTELRDRPVAERACDDAPPGDLTEAAVSRRRWMKGAAAAAVGGTAIALGSSQPAAAASNFQIGSSANQDPVRTSATHTGAGSDMGFLFTARATHDPSFGSSGTYPAALAGWSYSPGKPTGVYGYSSATTGNAHGVAGIGNSPQGAGVLAQNQNVAGVGLRARAGSSGWGVDASGNVGVNATGSEYGVQASGDGAAIYIPPVNTVAPPDRGVTQSPGAIDTHTTSLILGTSHLWFCVDGGVSGGDWRKVAGPDTAGAFHAVEPFRAYDSRRAQPSPGRLASGASRVVSIASSRDGATGAVIAANVVPNRARAVTYNVTVAASAGRGFLSVAPGDVASSSTSAVNWTAAGQNLANAGVVKLDGSRQIKVFCGGAGSTDFIVDITGYYL